MQDWTENLPHTILQPLSYSAAMWKLCFEDSGAKRWKKTESLPHLQGGCLMDQGHPLCLHDSKVHCCFVKPLRHEDLWSSQNYLNNAGLE